MKAGTGDPLSAGHVSQVDRYRVLVPIASGGMAIVYLAEQTGIGGFGRQVALKLVHAHLRDDPQWADALVEEAKLASRVRHPNVVQTLDVGQAPQGVFLVMEYIEGDTLASLIRHGTSQPSGVVPLPIALRILVDVLGGLHAAHELTDEDGRCVGLVHRDFSPQNVIVGLDGIARLADFGIAKAEGRAGVTQTGVVKGKFGFMSPEQVRGIPLDRRCDVWAAGIVAWELVVGKRLYPGLDEAAILYRVLEAPPARVSSMRAALPATLDEVIASALRLDREERCPDAHALRERLVYAASADGVALATHEEVGRFVAASAGARLEALRRAAREARDGPSDAVPTTGAQNVPAPPADAATQTTSVSDSGKTTQPRREPTRLAPILIVATASAAIALVAGLRVGAGNAHEQTAAAAAVALASPSAVEPVSADGGDVAPPLSAPPTEPATATASALLESPVAGRGAAHRHVRLTHGAPPAPVSSPPAASALSRKLLENPY